MTDLPTSAASVLRLTPSTQDEVNRFSNQIIQAVKNGEENPLDILLQVRALEKCFKIIVDKIKDNYLTEAGKYPGDKFTFKGNDVQKADVWTSYDYGSSGDTIWEQRKSIELAAQTLVKEREEFLRTLREPITTLDEGTGEIVTIRPPHKTTIPGLKITIK